ncbi:MAG: hypothetical protein AAF372_03610, partial [Pseudomonadota bacterium]
RALTLFCSVAYSADTKITLSGVIENSPLAGFSYSLVLDVDSSEFNAFVDRNSTELTLTNTFNGELTGIVRFGEAAFINADDADSFSINGTNDLTLPDGTFIGDAFGMSLSYDNGVQFDAAGQLPQGLQNISVFSATHNIRDPLGELLKNNLKPNLADDLENIGSINANFNMGSFNILATQFSDDLDAQSITTNQISEQFIALGTFDSYSITIVPIPAAAWLFGSSLLGFLGLTYRKRS